MAKYIVKYKFNGKERSVKRIADNAGEAIDRLVNQYSWLWKLSMVDADTRGSEWCSGIVDVDGGINYDMRIIAHIEEVEE